MVNYDPTEYEDKIKDVDELSGTDIKINPDYYIHLALTEINKTFKTEMGFKESIERYIHIVEHLELLCESAGLITSDYEENLKEFKAKDSYKAMPLDKQNIKLAMKKLRLILNNVFKHKPLTDSVRL